jgi:phosphate/sulfate permease
MTDVALGTWLPTGLDLPSSTVCGITLAWVLRLPTAIMLSATLYVSLPMV